MKEKYILISAPGKTDPIRQCYDGPILHIIRYYRPETVYLLFTKEIGNIEKETHYIEESIELLRAKLNIDLRVIPVFTDIEDPHSYDILSKPVQAICRRAAEEYPENKILLNITSGTPQLETAMCMEAISKPELYIPVQVATPNKASNADIEHFNSFKDSPRDWFDLDFDNEPDAESRCIEPKLFNYRNPIIGLQIKSLIDDYDYSGALKLARNNFAIFSDKTVKLIEFALLRLNLDYDGAVKIAAELKMSGELYRLSNAKMNKLTDYFNAIDIKQKRRELNDFSVRVNIFIQELYTLFIENTRKITILNDLCFKKDILDEKKCEKHFPEISDYIYKHNNNGFSFDWDKAYASPSNLRYFADYIIENNSALNQYADSVKKLGELTKTKLRNKSAHSLTGVTESEMREDYGVGSKEICDVLFKAYKQFANNSIINEDRNYYDQLNELIYNELVKMRE